MDVLGLLERKFYDLDHTATYLKASQLLPHLMPALGFANLLLVVGKVENDQASIPVIVQFLDNLQQLVFLAT